MTWRSGNNNSSAQPAGGGFVFELSRTLPAPLSVAQRNKQIVLLLREGAIVDAALVQALNDLTRAEDEDDVAR